MSQVETATQERGTAAPNRYTVKESMGGYQHITADGVEYPDSKDGFYVFYADHEVVAVYAADKVIGVVSR